MDGGNGVGVGSGVGVGVGSSVGVGVDEGVGEGVAVGACVSVVVDVGTGVELLQAASRNIDARISAITRFIYLPHIPIIYSIMNYIITIYLSQSKQIIISLSYRQSGAVMADAHVRHG
jgi:hypothetical protein